MSEILHTWTLKHISKNFYILILKTQDNFNFINVLKYIMENVVCPDKKWTHRMLLWVQH